MKTFILLSLVFMASCSTPYQPKGFRGGYSDQRLGRDLYRVTFKGNGYTDQENVEEMLLKRCAELSIENGYSYFMIVNGNGRTDANYIVNGNASSYGNQITGSATVSSVEKHTASAVIKMMNSPGKQDIAYDAGMILGNRRPKNLPKSEDIDKITADETDN